MNGWEHARVSTRRLGIRLTVLAGLVGLVGAFGAAAYLAIAILMGAGGSARTTCAPTVGDVPIEAAGPISISSEQLANAAAIVATGRQLGVPERGLWVALATALQESGLRNLDYGDRDSLGLFQQRPSQGWGSPAQVRDPRYAATQFFTRLIDVPDWTSMPLWQSAQTVQRSAFPLAYAKWEQEAADILAAVGNASPASAAVGAGGCAPGSLPPLPSGGSGCTEDDPTTNGCVTPTTRYALLRAESAFGGLRSGAMIRSTGCYAQRPANPTSDHPLGKGCDFFPGTAGRFATGTDADNGWRAAGWFRDNATTLQVSYVIWQGRIWIPGRPDQGGWGIPYTGGGVYDPTDAVGGHYDHLHVSFQK